MIELEAVLRALAAGDDAVDLGEVTEPPRLPDAGALVVIVYLADARIILAIDDRDDDGATVTRVTYTGL